MIYKKRNLQKIFFVIPDVDEFGPEPKDKELKPDLIIEPDDGHDGFDWGEEEDPEGGE